MSRDRAGASDDAPARSLRERVADALGTAVESVAELDGGEVGRVARVTLADGRTVAAKTGETPLRVEAFVLEFLADRGLPVPEVYHRADDLLILEYVEGDSEITPAVERDAARHLAALHGERPTGRDGPNGDPSRRYGFPRDTLTGPYRQPNPWTDSWVAFFRDRRLRYFAGKASEAGLLTPSLADRLDALAADLDSLLPENPPPALLHGDVWANNVIARGGRVRAFLDPTCYFGHAEVELAYVDFAGSFGDVFFETYDDERGIDAGFWDERRGAYQIVPLLEHLLYFGDDRYAADIRERLADLGY
ncbi:fructosamine kinase family protein [Halorussus gelatinilyticus]|uniref:Fructosamine kinase family protein n=1 Tax=Halorussus gelatinilyticus TaxID=2937524 RepID=A0A8U0IHG3_9EURY|nr:fructosamine kinase family protein [Halorussus gelatinilyticus]UPV99518.1 fructosamine kinase family protein [Halorussus gelatinilyticus]